MPAAHPHPTEDTLDQLIASAQHEALRARPRPAVRQPRSFISWAQPIMSLVALGLALHFLVALIVPPSRKQVERDLDVVVSAAHMEVEAARSRNGQLPMALPNAALAAVVQYRPDGDKYSLSSSVLGVRVTLTSDGSKTTDWGTSP